MAKWFKEFPINLKNGTDRIRSASESGSQSRSKPGLVAGTGTKTTGSKGSQRKNPSGVDSGGGGVGSLLSGRNRKNSANELGRNGTGSIKDGKVWDSLLPGKSRKNSKADTGIEEHRPLKSSSSANAFISRLIKVDKQDKSSNFTSGTSGPTVPDPEKGQPLCKTETVRGFELL